jgi:long-chain acyl-CoA synthetase
MNPMMYKKNLSIKTEITRFNVLRDSVSDGGAVLYVGRLLQRAARLFPNRIALIYHDIYITYQELYIRACKTSRMLHTLGVRPADKVTLFIENSIEFYVAYYGIWQLGAVVVPLNTFLRQAELAHILADASPVCIVTSAEYVSLFEEIGVPLPPLVMIDTLPKDSVMCGESDQHLFHALDPDAMAALLYTSGTTGMPKGVMLSSRAIMANILQSVLRLDFASDERVLGVLPLFHAFAQLACVWAPLFVGAAIIVVPKIERHFILEAFTKKPTIVLGVPALYGLFCLMRTVPFESVKYCVSGGDALSDKIRAYFALLYRRTIASGYGLTETAPVISFTLEDELMPTGTVGYPLCGITCSVRDDNGNEVLAGAIGELWVRGDNVMLGYHNDQVATDKVVRDGFFNTGDLVCFDDKGRLVITGRTKDLLINKGFNIYPQEIENVIMSHQNVLQVGVVGKKDEQVGDIPIAFVQLRTPDAHAAQQLKLICTQHLAAYKVPKMFVCDTKALPTTATGKVDKKQLRIMALDLT